MNSEKMLDASKNLTTSQAGNKFSYESPIPGVHVYSNVWPEAMDFFQKLDTDEFWENEATKLDKPWIREDYLDKETGKKSQTCWLDHHSEIEAGLAEVIDSYLYHWNVDPHSREDLRITKFAGTGEFFGMHPDDSFATPRTVSMVYYPNDDYEGGELNFMHFGVQIKPKANQLFLFPAGYSYEHFVTPVTGGNPRITLVTFFNQMTPEERGARVKYINPNKYYQPEVSAVMSQQFMRTQWPKY